MATILEELCLLAQLMTGATRVTITRQNSSEKTVEIIARTNGQTLIQSILTTLPLLGPSKPILRIRDVRKHKEFDKHPVHLVVPNLKSLIAFYFETADGPSHTLVIWNPINEFFGDMKGANALDQISEIIRSVLAEPAGAESRIALQPNQSGNTAGLEESVASFSHEPASNFLTETLIVKQRLLARNGVSYVALRQWRKPIKPFQISALTAIKRHHQRPIVETIATEMAKAVDGLYGKFFTSYQRSWRLTDVCPVTHSD